LLLGADWSYTRSHEYEPDKPRDGSSSFQGNYTDVGAHVALPSEPSEPLGVQLEFDRMCGPGSESERAGSDQYPPLERGSGTPT
jgi:hypothetical protein